MNSEYGSEQISLCTNLMSLPTLSLHFWVLTLFKNISWGTVPKIHPLLGKASQTGEWATLSSAAQPPLPALCCLLEGLHTNFGMEPLLPSLLTLGKFYGE